MIVNEILVIIDEKRLNLSQISTKISGAGPQNVAYCRSHLNPSGNWCGHDPNAPKFFEPNTKHANRPDIIQWATANLQRFYNKPTKWLKSLHSSRESARQQRTEGRERDADVLGVLLHYTELASLRVGVPLDDGKFISLDMKFIAKKLGWRSDADDKNDLERIACGVEPLNRGVKRVWRSITALKRAGYLTVHQRCEKNLEGEKPYKGLPAVRCIQPKLFWDLGIGGTKLRAKREQAAKRLKKKYAAHLDKLKNGLKFGKQGPIQKAFKFSSSLENRNAKKWRAEKHFANEKRRQQQCYELMLLPENKGLSSVEFYQKYPQLQIHALKQKE